MKRLQRVSILVLSVGLAYLINSGRLAAQPAPAAPQNLRLAVATPSPVEPWFEDSFEGAAPFGWRADWGCSTLAAHDTTDVAGAPPGGGPYSYRQWYREAAPAYSPVADHETNTFRVINHRYENGTPVRFSVGAGGVLPMGVTTYNGYYIVNKTDDTFQVRLGGTSGSREITDNGTSPFTIWEFIENGNLSLTFGENKQVPLIGNGDDISISYWLKYHRDFDHGAPTGSKHWMMASNDAPDTDRVYHIISGDNGRMMILFQALPFTNPSHAYANVNGIPGGDQNYYMPVGQWIKFDWYIKVSPDMQEGRKGILKGWVNNVLRWNYSDITTIRSGAYQGFTYWAQFASGPPRGENQERYLDLFRIGPGAMVLREQEDHGAL